MYPQASGGPLQSIANFFQNIGPKKKKKDKGGNLMLPDIEQNGSLTAPSTGTSPRPPSTPRNSKTTSARHRRMTPAGKQPERNYTCSDMK